MTCCRQGVELTVVMLAAGRGTRPGGLPAHADLLDVYAGLLDRILRQTSELVRAGETSAVTMSTRRAELQR